MQPTAPQGRFPYTQTDSPTDEGLPYKALLFVSYLKHVQLARALSGTTDGRIQARHLRRGQVLRPDGR